MIDIEQSILQVFKNNPSQEFDTSKLTKLVFPEYLQVEKDLENLDKDMQKSAKYRKFQLHRKILYYMSKLVKENIIKISSIKDKGEKCFMLALDEGDITLEKGYKRIIITKPALPKNNIEQYEHKKIMKKYEEETWINRVNSIILECSKVNNPDKLMSIIKDISRNINDVIALNDFESLLIYDLKEWLELLNTYTMDLDRTISIIINTKSAGAEALKNFIKYFSDINPKKINIVFNISSKDLQKLGDIFRHIIEEFSRQKIKINIKNSDLSNAPIFKGRAGMYGFDEEEYSIYQKNIKGKVFGLLCSQSSIAVNINKFFEEYKTDAEFRKAILEAAKTLLQANAIQRRKSNEFFKNINLMNSPSGQEFYKFSRNYIRFWNYDWHKDIEENKNLIQLLSSTKDVVSNFCFGEETIYKSCGIPIRFRIAFSSAFRNFDTLFMGERDYKKANVRKTEDYYKGEIKKFLEAREKLFEVFDGSDRLRIFRTMDFDPNDIVHEFTIILSSYKIPFFTYDFSGLKGVVKLTNFL